MYINIKLPPAFGAFNRLQKENYPFNSLFTTYLAAVSRLGLLLHMDVEDLVGYIEDRAFGGRRLPDVPEGDEPVGIRYKTDDKDVQEYIGQSSLTNRMAVMYIARMTLRLSAAYGTSLFRLTRLINDLKDAAGPRQEELPKEHTKAVKKEHVKPDPKPKREEKEDVSPPMPRISSKAPATTVQSAPVSDTPAASAKASAQAARDAIAALQGLTAKASEAETDDDGSEIVETNPFLSDFF